MKFLIVSFALVAFAAAQVSPPIAILKQSQDSSPDGSYSFSYDTENGIFHAESGVPVSVDGKSDPAVVAQGEYQYTAPDGTPIVVKYVADHDGFRPEGAHIPQIPLLIQRALQYNKEHPEQEE